MFLSNWRLTFINFCLPSTVWADMYLVQRVKTHLSQPCSSPSVRDQNSSCSWRTTDTALMSKTHTLSLHLGYTIICSQQYPRSPRAVIDHTQEIQNTCKTEGTRRFINWRTTDVMDDFVPCGKWSGLLFEILNHCWSSIKKTETVKNPVWSRFKEARHPVSAFTFIANERVSLGPGEGDLDFIGKESERKRRPFWSLLFITIQDE